MYLFYCCKLYKGYIKMIELNKVLDFNFFYVVCRGGYFKVVKFLIFKGVVVNLYDIEGNSFLYLVCFSENV